MLDGVLDERLQEQTRQNGCLAIGGDFPLEPERPAVTRLEDLRVALQPLDLVGEQLRFAPLLDGVAQEVTQAREQPPRLPRIFRDEACDRVERVEHEVRLEVRAKSLELGVGTNLLRLQHADACALDCRRVHERQGPEAVPELRVHRADGGGPPQAVGHVEAQLGDVHGHESVKNSERAAERHGDAETRQQRLPGAHAASDRPAEGPGQGQHEQGHLERHERGAGENPRALAPCDDVGPELKEHDPDDHADPERAPAHQLAGCARRGQPWEREGRRAAVPARSPGVEVARRDSRP